MLYEFAGLVIEIEFLYDFCKRLCRNYEYHGQKQPDFCIRITDEMIQAEKVLDKELSSQFDDAYIESIAAYRAICTQAYAFGCMLMHCSAIAYKGNVILITAPSGTGKSTHARLWRRYFGEDVLMVNDDKPLLKNVDGVIYACGTPWDGKHHLSTNVMLPVKAIVMISQSPQNTIQRATKRELLYFILNQTIRPEDEALMQKTLEFTELLLKQVPAYKLGCTISEEAVQVCFDAVKENFDED